jgi:arsenate reductase
MYVIYYDPGCVYSLICLAVLRSKKVNYKKVKYLKEPLTLGVIKDLIKKLNISAIDLVRQDHPDWKSFYKNLELTDEEVIHLMLENHGLIMRPIIVNEDQAVIGRPPKKLVQLINQNNSDALNYRNEKSIFW